jgi:hypothetical protein
MDDNAGGDGAVDSARSSPTVATRLHQSGVDALVIEDLLGHLTGVRGGIAGVYNAATTLDRQRRALTGWSATLAAFETPEPILTGVASAKQVHPWYGEPASSLRGALNEHEPHHGRHRILREHVTLALGLAKAKRLSHPRCTEDRDHCGSKELSRWRLSAAVSRSAAGIAPLRSVVNAIQILQAAH